jgi:hypothetical protein
MKTLITLTAATVLTMLASNVQAAPLFSASTELTSEYQILTQGTQVWGGAATYNGGSRTLANGVDFDAIYNNANFVGTDLPGGVTLKTDGAYYGAHSNVSGFSDPVLNSVLEGDALGSYGQIFVDGLTAGHVYQLQLIVNMTHTGDIGGGFNNPSSVYSGSELVQDITQGGSTTLDWGQTYNPVTMTYSGTGANYVTETFVAPTGGQEYLLLSGAGSVLDGNIEVRDITAVPEPSTYAMMLAGLAVLGFCVRRKGALVK